MLPSSESLVWFDSFIDDPIIAKYEEYILTKEIIEKKKLTRMLLKESNGIASVFIWKNYLVKKLLLSENSMTIEAESGVSFDKIDSFSKKLFLEDIEVIRRYFETDPYTSEYGENEIANIFLNSSCSEIAKELFSYYYNTGVGIFSSASAFRFDKKLIPVYETDEVNLNTLIGIEYQKQKLIENTMAMIDGKPFLNVLLFGDRGTGKSSLVKGVFKHLEDKRLKLVEIDKSQLTKLDEVMELLSNRNFFFILFLDDLSFEENEVEYKMLKAHIEGTIRKKPNNVVIYATSNRQHIVKEVVSDNYNITNELHLNDAIQEKLSLADRFGLTLTFDSPNAKSYLNIVKELLVQNNIEMDDEKIRILASRWAMTYHGKSGRSAKHFVDAVCSGMVKGG